MDKKTLREKAKKIRLSLDIKMLSAKIVKNIKTNQKYIEAKNVMIFYPFGSEIDLLELLEDKTKNFYLPKVSGKNLKVCPFQKGDALEISTFNTSEPKTHSISDLKELDLIFVPALMADKINNRLGYGGGFYDRFLSQLPTKINTIVPIASDLLVDKIPFDEFDEVVDEIITEL